MQHKVLNATFPHLVQGVPLKMCSFDHIREFFNSMCASPNLIGTILKIPNSPEFILNDFVKGALLNISCYSPLV